MISALDDYNVYGDSNLLSVSGRRKAIRPFTFSGGVNVAKGNWVSVPQRAISHDPRYYLEPMEFNGMRFLDGNNGNPSRFADSSNKWHFWGCGKLLWSVS